MFLYIIINLKWAYIVLYSYVLYYIALRKSNTLPYKSFNIIYASDYRNDIKLSFKMILVSFLFLPPTKHCLDLFLKCTSYDCFVLFKAYYL